MRINEIFYSIQGEGSYVGVPVVFVRTQGCSLHCPFCDSASTWYDKSAIEYTPQQLVQKVAANARSGCNTVVITGGEPTEQEDLYTCAEALKFEGWKVHLETNGTAEEILPHYFAHVVCSPKPGASYHISKGVSELKYVLNKHSDIAHIIPAWVREKYKGRIWLQPEANGDEVVAENVKFCYDNVMKDPRLRMGMQFHKILGVK